MNKVILGIFIFQFIAPVLICADEITSVSQKSFINEENILFWDCRNQNLQKEKRNASALPFLSRGPICVSCLPPPLLKSQCGGGVPSSHPSLGLSVLNRRFRSARGGSREGGRESETFPQHHIHTHPLCSRHPLM